MRIIHRNQSVLLLPMLVALVGCAETTEDKVDDLARTTCSVRVCEDTIAASEKPTCVTDVRSELSESVTLSRNSGDTDACINATLDAEQCDQTLSLRACEGATIDSSSCDDEFHRAFELCL